MEKGYHRGIAKIAVSGKECKIEKNND